MPSVSLFEITVTSSQFSPSSADLLKNISPSSFITSFPLVSPSGSLSPPSQYTA